jgi:AcrR family transcriptional regulator
MGRESIGDPRHALPLRHETSSLDCMFPGCCPLTMPVEPEPEVRTRKRKKAALTQEERSAAMRERLLNATLDCLVDVGYGRTTTVEVAERAGVSRGAMLHHYPSRLDLVAAAIEHLAERRVAEFVASIGRLPPGTDVVRAAIDLLWEQFTSGSFHAALELIVASRTDAELRERIGPLMRWYDDLVLKAGRDLFARFAPSPEIFEENRRLVYYTLHGLALRRVMGMDDDELRAALDEIVKRVARTGRRGP